MSDKKIIIIIYEQEQTFEDDLLARLIQRHNEDRARCTYIY